MRQQTASWPHSSGAHPETLLLELDVSPLLDIVLVLDVPELALLDAELLFELSVPFPPSPPASLPVATEKLVVPQ